MAGKCKHRSISNLPGQTVIQNNLNERESLINTSNLQTGIYLLQLRIGNTTSNEMLVKE
ncbi:MAG: T9SS type A sorting domain-containing protein [bacterium]|nr:T9SS type A sorting domain-containing protein [bacterium]